MTDPFLEAHIARRNGKPLPGLYIISGPGPISIRDQLMRGKLIIDRLYRAGHLTAPAKVLVVGGGGAGITAAIRGAERGVQITLVEERLEPFFVQREAQTRHVCPTQYDWPHDNYLDGIIPGKFDRLMPLECRQGTGTEIAMAWTRLWQEKDTNADLLRPYFGVTFKNCESIEDNKFKVKFVGDSVPSDVFFDIIIWAAGFGVEETGIYSDKHKTVHTYIGRKFWGSDKYTQPNLGLPNKPKVLIAGGGDGALQDFIRVVTGVEYAGKFIRDSNVPQELLAPLQRAEERAHRARLWAQSAADLAPYLLELDKVHRAAAADAVNAADAPSRNDCYDTLDKLLWNREIPETVLACKENCITAYYGLNRFILWLLVAFFTKQSKKLGAKNPITISFNRSVSMVKHKSHEAGDYSECEGKNHTVVFNEDEFEEHFNVVIVRFGLKDRPNFDRSSPVRVAFGQHLLPYSLPRGGS